MDKALSERDERDRQAPDMETTMSDRESMPYDVVIVGAGPAGLAAAIRLKQLAADAGQELSVCILEKGSEVGAHILSGAVVDPRALDELLPDWRTMGCPLADTPVTENHHWVLTKNKRFGMPHLLLPPFMNNHGTYTGSLGNLCRWLAEQAEGLGVEIFPGFAAAEVLFDEDRKIVRGVATGDMGVARDGTHKGDYQPGLELHAKYTFFAEGVRGSLSKELIRLFDLRADSEPQVYGIGIKELWDVDPAKHVPGRVIHTQGWPLSETDGSNGGGSCIIRRAGRSRSASSPGSATPTRICRRSRKCSGGRRIRRSARCWRAASASPTARARSATAAINRCRSSSSRAAR